MKKEMVIITHTPIDYDSRVIKQVKHFAKEYRVILYSMLLNEDSLKVFDECDVEVNVIPVLYSTKTSRNLLETYLEEKYTKSFKNKLRTFFKKKLDMNYSFTEIYYTFVPSSYWCRKKIADRYQDDYSNVAAILVNDIKLIHPVGRIRKKIRKEGFDIPMVCDLHEAHYEYKSGMGIQQNLAMELMRRNLKLADIICAPSIKTLDGYFKIGVKYKPTLKSKVVYNTANYEKLSPSKSKDECKLVHVGIASSDRKLEKMIEALKYLDDSYKLYFYLVTTNSSLAHLYIDELKDYAKQINVDDRVFFMDPVGPEELVETLNNYDVGVFYLEPSPEKKNFDYAAPNKLFQYVQARLAVVVTDIGEMGTIVNKYDVGTVSQYSAEDFAVKIEKANESLDYYKENSNIASKELSAEEQWKDISKFIVEYNNKTEGD